MKKNVALLVLLILIDTLAVPGWAARSTAHFPGPPTGPGKNATAGAGQDLIKLLPRSTNSVTVLDLKRIMEIDVVAKAMQDAKFKEGYDEFVKMSGIDPKNDIAYVGLGLPASVLMPTSGAYTKSISIVINLKYDKARLQGLIKEKIPEAKEEIYNGVTIYPTLDDADKQTAPHLLAEVGKMGFLVALLDATHIVLGGDQGVKGVIDVCQKKAEPLAKNPQMTALLSRVDKSGIAWGAFSISPELIKKAVVSNPQLKALEGLKGMTMAFDDKNSTFVADFRILGGTKEQNTTGASNFNGLKAILGLTYAAKGPAVGELVSGIAITSGKDFTRLTVTVSHETLGELWKLAEPQGLESQVLSKETEDLYRKGEYERAAEVGIKALEIAEKAFGPDHPDVAGSLYNLGLVYIKQHKDAEAEPLFKRALAITEKAFGPDDPRVATILEALSSLYLMQGQYPEAEPLYKRLLAVREKTLGPDHPDVAETLFNLGGLYYFQDRYEEGEPLFKRSLAIREKALGPDDLRTAEVLNGLARLYYFQDRYAEAEPLYERSVAIREKSLGPDHPDIADELNDLAKIYRTRGEYAKAEPLFKRSIAIREKSLGPDHPDVAESLNGLAVLYHVQGRYADAEPLYKRSLAIREKALGPDDPEVADSLKILAELYRATKRQKEAAELEARAARIRSIKR